MSLLLCFFANTTFAQDTDTRKYPLPDHGSIQLKVPVPWADDLRQPPDRLPPTIAFKPKSGNRFEILITPIWSASKGASLPNSEKIKELVQQASEQAKLQSVEKNLYLRELKGASGNGYYFSATDRAPEPEGYKYMTQGTIRVGDLMVMFTLLTNDGQEKVINDALSMLKSAIHMKSGTT
ncbi:MAG: hypothetical protein AB1560_04290 [Pseudomonadota bacterium]